MVQAHLPNLIQQMLQPEFYPHPVTESIKLIQTHISYVLLTGNYVYKLKKPVNLGFLDFSTLEKRKHFTHEEFRLNQKGASELYVQVISINLVGEKYSLEGKGEIVDYAVKMRQFPQEYLFSELFNQHKLTETQLEKLGYVVAEYHSHAETNDYISSFGQPSQIRLGINNNYQQTQKYIGDIQSEKQVQEIKQYTDKFFEHNSELFTERITNKIRECHGDLHLKNIAYWHDKIMLFDCIEFNEPFRFVDVMYDVAFTVMDIEARGREDLANTFLNTYLEQTGDWEGLQILPLYLVRQAYVRAKVNSLLLDDPNITTEAREKARKTASAYYHQAWNYTQTKPGKIIVMSGLSGSGKSTTAKYLARQIGAIHLRSDAVRKHLAGISLFERGGDKIYTPAMTQKTYSRLLSLGITLANQGWTVILDAKYDRQHLRQEVINQATHHQLSLQIIYCTAPIEVLQERLTNRTGDIADATSDLLVSQLNQAEPFTNTEQPYIKILDTTQPKEEQLKQLAIDKVIGDSNR